MMFLFSGFVKIEGRVLCFVYILWSVPLKKTKKLFCSPQTDTIGGTSTDEAERRWPLVPVQHHKQGANRLQPQVIT